MNGFESIFRAELSNILSSKLALAVEESITVNLIGDSELVADPDLQGDKITFELESLQPEKPLMQGKLMTVAISEK